MKLVRNTVGYVALPFLPLGYLKIGYDLYNGKSLKEQLDFTKVEFKFPCLAIQNTREFEFSTIPVKKELYIALKELPDFYFNLINIHERILKYKMEAFLDFCSSLGVKEARIVNDKEIGEHNNINLEASSDDKIKAGLKVEQEKSSKNFIQKSFSFPKPKYKLHECENQFYKLEPDWVKIEKLRLDPLKDITKAEIQIKKFHDFNLSIDFRAMVNSQNIDLGFKNKDTFNETFIYELEFWEKE